MTVGSLFSGIGGFELGFLQAGLCTIDEILWEVEIDDFCNRVLERHFPNAKRYRDIRDVGRHNLAPVDLICGGDPCQRNSNAWRHGNGEASLGNEFIRVVDEVRPDIVLRENPATVRKDAPWPWQRFRKELEQIGYVVLPFRVRACCIGADFRGERLFLLATLQKTERPGLERYEFKEMVGTKQGGQNTNIARSAWWHTAPRICGKPHGISHRVDRLKALGNAVVPAVVQAIGSIIMEWESGKEAGK